MLYLVLKTSNSARLVLLKSNEHYAKWWRWARPHVQIHSIERSGQFCNIWRGCNTKNVARYDHQVVLVDRQKHVFCTVTSLVDLPKCHRDLQALSVLTSIRTRHFERRYQFFTQNCEISELVPIMFRNSACFPVLVLEKVRFLPSTKECSKVEIVLVLVPAQSYQA